MVRGGKQSPGLEFLFLFVQAKRKREKLRRQNDLSQFKRSLKTKHNLSPYTTDIPFTSVVNTSVI